MPKAHVPAQRAQARGRPAPHALRTYAWRHAVDSMEVWRRCGIAWRCGKGGGMEGHLAALQPFCAPTHSTMCRTQRPARGSSDKNFRLCPSTDGRPYLLGFEKFLVQAMPKSGGHCRSLPLTVSSWTFVLGMVFCFVLVMLLYFPAHVEALPPSTRHPSKFS